MPNMKPITSQRSTTILCTCGTDRHETLHMGDKMFQNCTCLFQYLLHSLRLFPLRIIKLFVTKTSRIKYFSLNSILNLNIFVILMLN